MSRPATLGFTCLLLSSLAGCGDGKHPVEGTVSFEGTRVSSGMITFVGTEGAMAREGAVIRDGAFRARLLPGKYRVELNAPKVVGKRTQKGFDGKDEVLELTEELFPPRFNTSSELTETIKPGPNTLTLNVKTKS